MNTTQKTILEQIRDRVMLRLGVTMVIFAHHRKGANGVNLPRKHARSRAMVWAAMHEWQPEIQGPMTWSDIGKVAGGVSAEAAAKGARKYYPPKPPLALALVRPPGLDPIATPDAHELAIDVRNEALERFGVTLQIFARHPVTKHLYRDKKSVWARVEVWRWMRTRQNRRNALLSFPEIGAACGCPHTTVLTATKDVRPVRRRKEAA